MLNDYVVVFICILLYILSNVLLLTYEIEIKLKNIPIAWQLTLIYFISRCVNEIADLFLS